MVQRFVDWCREWKGPPYATLQDCIAEQHESALNLFQEAIDERLKAPAHLLSYSTLEWLGAWFSWPGQRVILEVASSSPEAVADFGIDRTTFEGWFPYAISAAIYLIFAFAIVIALRRRK